MKVPLKARDASYIEVGPVGIPDYTERIKIYDYAHEDVLLGEVAGHVFNRYLRFNKSKDWNGEHFEFRLGGSHPYKAILQLHTTLSLAESEKAPQSLRIALYEDVVEELLHKAFEAIDFKHNIEHPDKLVPHP